MINDLFIPRERCSKLQLLSLSCVNNLQFNRLRLFELSYFEFPVISNLNQFPFGLDFPFTHLLSVTLNSCYFKLFLFPLTVQNNGVQLYDYDYKNNKTFVPGEGIPFPTKKILIRKTIFYSIVAEPQKISNFLNTGDTTWALWQNELWFHIKMRPILCMNFFFRTFSLAWIFFSDIFPCMNFFLVFSPLPPSLF